MDTEKEKIRFPLSRRLTLMVLGAVLALSILQVALSYMHYRREMLEHYERTAMNIGAVAASQLEPDRIQHYLDTGETDEAYDESYRILCDIQQNAGVRYLYVVKPELDEVWYVLDTDQSEDAIPLGFHEPYYEGAFKENAEKMARGEHIDPIVSDEEFGWLMSVYYPMMTSEGEPAGYVGVDIEMVGVRQDLASFTLQMIILVMALSLVISAIFIRSTKKTVSDPIKQLSAAADQLVRDEQAGHESETAIFRDISIKSRDEIGVLYRSLRQMEIDINEYIHDLMYVTAEKERIGTELNVATNIQANMLPRIFPPFPDRNEFDLYASMTPAKEIGGDFYDFFLVDDDHLALVMADVSGKGVPAALFMVIAKTLIKNRAQMGGGPSEILAYVNDQLCEGNEAELFVTVWLAIVELSTGKGVAANAGHEHPVLRRGSGDYQLVEYRHSPAVAAMEGMRFREHEFELYPGDALFVYTDGVAEATDPDNQLFGTDRTLAALNALPAGASAGGLLEQNLHGDAPQVDDITMLGMEYYGTGGKNNA